MHAFVTQHVNYESIMRWRREQKQHVLARALPPSLLALWRFGLVSQHTAWQNKYMPDVDPNRFVHQPPPLWVEQQGGAYEPTAIERRLWQAESAGAPEMMRLATQMEHELSKAVNTNDSALEHKKTLVERLEALSAPGWAILNDTKDISAMIAVAMRFCIGVAVMIGMLQLVPSAPAILTVMIAVRCQNRCQCARRVKL